MQCECEAKNKEFRKCIILIEQHTTTKNKKKFSSCLLKETYVKHMCNFEIVTLICNKIFSA